MTNLAVSAAVANGITEGLFNTNLVQFMTGRINGIYAPGTDGSTVITLPELLGAGPGGIGGNFGRGYSLSSVVRQNFSDNMGSIAMAVIGIPIAVKVASKVLRKPILNPMNKALKMTGLDVKV